MSAPSGLWTRSSNRGRGLTRAGVRSRGSKAVARSSQPIHQESVTNGSGVEAQRGPRASNGTMARGGRKTPSTKNNVSQQQLKRPSDHNDGRNKSRRSPASLNAAIHSHAGKVAKPRDASWRHPPFEDPQLYNKQMNELYSTLKQNRERERKQAIKNGFLADPDKPTTLANAITPVGTCQDMCPEFERVERIVQLMVDGREKILTSPDMKEKAAIEDIMVKRFRRSAAGYDEQLPSDIRPPLVLKKTLDYLFNDVVGGPEPLAIVHKFVWDRTRSVRNDFSIQQVTRIEDLKIAIECFERIARFHILSLHQLSSAGSGADSGDFDPYQEREQLNNTLLSLQYYYDDSRHKLFAPNEAEFRAYGILFEVQDQRPDIEDRLQGLPKGVLRDRRVQTALKLHAAAGNISDEQGPLRPRTQFSTAQANSGGFWILVQSNAVSYLMACVAEVYFNLVRRTALEAIWKAYRGKRPGPTKMEDWTIDDLTHALGFDEEAQTRVFCEQHEFVIGYNANREQYIDLGSVTGGSLTDQNPRRKQIFSKTLVETKRLSRTLSAVIDGVSASQAHAQGFVEDITDADSASTVNSESLFVEGESTEKVEIRPRSVSPVRIDDINSDTTKHNPASASLNSSDAPKSGPFNSLSPSQTLTFGKPSTSHLTSIKQTGTILPLNPTAKSRDQAVSSVSPDQNDLLKVSPFESNSVNIPREKASWTTSMAGNEPPMLGFAKEGENSHNLDPDKKKDSPFARSTNVDLSMFGHTQKTNPLKVATSENITNQTRGTAISAAASEPSIFDQPSPSLASPKFSFGTSPLFQNTAAKQPETDTEDVSSKIKSETSKTPLFTTTQNPSVFPPNPLTLPQSSTKPDTQLSISSDKPASIGFPDKIHNAKPSSPTAGHPEISAFEGGPDSLNLNTKPSFELTQSSSPSEFNQTTKPLLFTAQNSYKSEASPPAPLTLGQPSRPQNSPSDLPQSTSASQHASNTSALPISAVSQSWNDVQTGAKKQKYSGPIILDQLSDAVMLERNGLLQQFIEFIVEPLIKSSVAQLEDEDSWKEANECRSVLLSKKYFRRWRTVAWNKSLMRKGRDRRRNFNKSIQNMTGSRQRRQNKPSFQVQRNRTDSAQKNDNREALTPPPSSKRSRRQSLTTAHSDQQTSAGTSNGVKRKRHENIVEAPHQLSRPAKKNHRRLQSLDSSFMSTLPHRRSQSPFRSRIDTSQVSEGSMLNDILMRQARQLAPSAKTDTTRTDYFRLKALGIDPDTPAVPLTKKRIGEHIEKNENNKSIRLSPPASTSASRAKAVPSTLQPQSGAGEATVTANNEVHGDDDDDEALYAQIRSVREALAESEQWFQSERQSIERSNAAPQRTTRVSPPQPQPSPETPSQRRLKEIRERGPTPSRSKLRLRAMGDKALLPAGFWDGDRVGSSLKKGKGKSKDDGDTRAPGRSTSHDEQQQQPNRLLGFAAMAHQMNEDLNDGGLHMHDFERSPAGASLEDAIEL